jgi:hypothetical protein
MTLPATALAAKVAGTVTVYYASAGPGTADGYENASVEIKYALATCSGEVHIFAGRIRGSVKASQRYWFEGAQVAATKPAPEAPSVEFTGTVLHGGTEIGRFAYLGDNHAAHDFPGDSCLSDSKRIGKLSDHLGQNPTDVQKDAFLRALVVRVDNPTRQLLRNYPLQDDIRAERLKAKRAAEAAEREKQEKARSEVQERKAAETKNLREQEETARKRGQTIDNSPTDRYAQGDFWGSGTAPSGTAGTSYVRSTDGGYFKLGKNGQNHEIDAKEYEAGRAQERQQREQQAPAGRSDSGTEAVARLHAEERRRQDAQQRVAAETDRKLTALSQSFYAAQEASQARDNIGQLTRMRGSYGSAEELERDYQHRLQGLREEMHRLEQANQSSLRSGTDLYFGDSPPAVGEFVNSLGTMLGNQRREKEEREARQKLDAERQRVAGEIETRRKAMLVEMRRELLANFPDGDVPLSSHKINVDVLYFFSYTLDPRQIERAQPAVTVIATFAAHRRGDGTWPLKNIINEDIRKRVPGENTLMGFYATRELAESMRASFIRLARQGAFQVAEVGYERKAPSGPVVGGVDFWRDTSNQGSQVQEKTPNLENFWR